MIVSVRIDNYSVYSSEAEFSMLADRGLRRFNGSVAKSAGFSLLKSACIFGANNAGKSCTLRAIAALKDLACGKGRILPKNIFTEDDSLSLGATFIFDNKAYSFDCTYKTCDGGGYFTYERLARMYSGKKEDRVIYLRDENEKIYDIYNVKRSASELFDCKSDLLTPFADCAAAKKLAAAAKILKGFSDDVIVLDMNGVTLEKTLNVLKNGGTDCDLVREFIRQADLDLDDIYYDNESSCKPLDIETENNSLVCGVNACDLSRLTTVRRGVKIKSVYYDSSGTKRIIAAASYICEALRLGKTLVVDELDCGFHFKLTRAVVSLFNNTLNQKAQLICTLHDATLLDCAKLFRKDQIWFAYKDRDGEYLYSLNDLEEAYGVSPKKIAEEYRDGAFGALPKPDLISLLIDSDKEE